MSIGHSCTAVGRRGAAMRAKLSSDSSTAPTTVRNTPRSNAAARRQLDLADSGGMRK